VVQLPLLSCRWASRFTLLAGAAAIVSCLAAPQAFGQAARRWVQASQADFESGKRENIALTSIGELRLGRKVETLVDDADTLVWALAVDSKGAVYAATGSDGRIFKIADGKAELFWKSEEPEILSLAVDRNDNLYAGTGPGGMIFRFTPDGDFEPYLDSDEKYIWGLALDSKGILYAATGDNGRLLKITAKDTAETVFETESDHLLDVVVDSKDNAYVCTATGGLVYRIDPAGKAFALFDSEDDDMHALALDGDDNLYVCTADGMQPGSAGFAPRGQEGPPPPAEKHPGPAEGRESSQEGKPGLNDADNGDAPNGEHGMPPAPKAQQEPPPAPRPPDAVAPPVEGINFIYKITPDGMVTSLFRREGIAVVSLLAHGGSIYAGTANNGQLLRIDSDLQVTIMAQMEQPQLSALAATPDGTLIVGTAGNGRVYRLQKGLAEEGTFTSMVKDATYQSRWGVIRCSGTVPEGASLTVSTRTGNTAEPDDKTWSNWSKEQPAGESTKIASPNGRFLQYRLRLKARGDASPVVRSVEVYYLPPNYRPRITAITFPPGPDGQAPAPQAPTGSVAATQKAAASPAKGELELTWQAEDPNGDHLTFEVYFKAADETTWKLVQDKLTEPACTWSTVRVPDGIYRIKIRADDSLSNPPGRALATEEVSEPFIIDNTPPAVSDMKAEAANKGDVTVTARLADAASPIQDAVYSVDSGDWILLEPVDGIFDSPNEAVQFTTDALEPGEHTIVINTRDAAGNVGAGKAVVVVPAR